MYSPGPSQWAFDGDCRWLWLDSLFCFCPLVQDHTYDVGVPSDTLLPLPRLLLLQWANVGAAGSAHLLGRAYLAHGHQIPARQRMNRYFQFPPHPPHRTFISSWQLFTFSQFQFFFSPLFFAWQEIVEDERSDKEETESEDEGADRELREKSKNGHMQNGHAALNNNHNKRDWLDCERWRRGWRRALTCSLCLKAKEQKRGIMKVAAHRNTHTHTYNLFFWWPGSLTCLISLLCGGRLRWRTTMILLHLLLFSLTKILCCWPSCLMLNLPACRFCVLLEVF